jgi:hypothetical protein
MLDDREFQTQQIQLLVQRLERISVDSTWARRSSGQRGALLRWLERLERQNQEGLLPLSKKEIESLQLLIDASYNSLEKAAREYIK